MSAVAGGDVRFTVPLYTAAEAARYLDVRETTFRTWVRGYRREFPDRPPVEGQPLITDLGVQTRGGPSIPFIGLAEGMFLSALRTAGWPLQQFRPALDLVRTKIGVEHALASKRLYVAGAQLLWEASSEDDIDDTTRHGARDLIVLRNNQYVFRQVIEQYFQKITYDEQYARRVNLPGYEVAEITTDPEVNFGRPYFTHTGTPLYVVQGFLEAGESIEDIADDFGLPVDQVTEVAQRHGLFNAKGCPTPLATVDRVQDSADEPIDLEALRQRFPWVGLGPMEETELSARYRDILAAGRRKSGRLG